MNSENIIIIGNPIAGGGAEKKIRKASDVFKDKGFCVELIFTEKKGDAESFAKEIAGKPSTLVVAAGGDGTYNEVANGLIKSNTPMAILPVGTTSVLARELKMPSQISRAIDFIINGKEQIVHSGMITLTTNSCSYKRYFLLMAGIGFDGEAVFGVNESIKKHTGKGGYILSGLSVLLKYNPQPITIIAYDAEIIKKGGTENIHQEDDRIAHNAVSLTGYAAVIGKAACYGGDFKITPHARLTEPAFYIFVAHSKSRASIVNYFAGIAVKTHLKYNDISYLKAAKVDVWGSSKVQIDGDYAGTTPARIEVVPDALRLIVNNY